MASARHDGLGLTSSTCGPRVSPHGQVSPGKLPEMRVSGPTPDPLDQNRHFTETPDDAHENSGLRGAVLRDKEFAFPENRGAGIEGGPRGWRAPLLSRPSAWARTRTAGADL